MEVNTFCVIALLNKTCYNCYETVQSGYRSYITIGISAVGTIAVTFLFREWNDKALLDVLTLSKFSPLCITVFYAVWITTIFFFF